MGNRWETFVASKGKLCRTIIVGVANKSDLTAQFSKSAVQASAAGYRILHYHVQDTTHILWLWDWKWE
jgi:hypothetical protein